MDYSKLLKRAEDSLPESIHEKQRFEIAKITGKIQGNMTILTNFVQIANYLHRDPEHMLKFILKELAAPGSLKSNKTVIIGTKVSASKINEKIKQYAEKYVLCYECGKPDTKLEKQDKVMVMKCMACGAKHTVR
jgi:translation initiation factor 2 subunit 2